MLRYHNQDFACQISSLIYDKFLIESYGIKNCDINYKEGDLIEKILRKKIIDNGYNCEEFPRCNREEFFLTPLRLPDRYLNIP